MRNRKLVALVVFALIATGGYGDAAGSGITSSALGLINGHGDVKVDNLPIPPTSALFAGDRVTTGTDSAAVLNLGWGASVSLGSNSSLGLTPNAASQELYLERGVAIIRSGGQGLTVIHVSGSEVWVGGGRFPALCRIAMLGGHAGILADRGRVEVSRAGHISVLLSGKWYLLNASPQAGATGQTAGSVTAAIPQENVRRGGPAAPEQSLSLHATLDWHDQVHTLRTGRVRITLLDGSVLNVGADSVMNIVRHVPQAQQTQIQLTLGRMRAEVKHLTQPGSSFQVQTQTAVIGVVGTIFVVQALANLTRVWCIEGVVEVHNILTTVAGSVTLHAGQFTTVPRGMPPTGAVQASASQINSEVGQTTIPSLPPVAAPGLAMTGANLGLAGTAAGLSTVALSRTSDASSAANQAQANAQAAVTAANNAATSASNAAIAASNAAATSQIVQNAASTALPTGCGCPP